MEKLHIIAPHLMPSSPDIIAIFISRLSNSTLKFLKPVKTEEVCLFIPVPFSGKSPILGHKSTGLLLGSCVAVVLRMALCPFFFGIRILGGLLSV